MAHKRRLSIFSFIPTLLRKKPNWFVPDNCICYKCFATVPIRSLCPGLWLISVTRLPRKCLRFYFLDPAALQSQHPMAAAGEGKIMGGNERGQLVVAM